ncbi:MAG: regulatory signaling modulator protein AmpE [Tatlockia sp.]|nr:regulatory signaling modulator protein AmpE [Tatlockia sp.]
MKLLVILICLLSERYLVHALSYLRFTWFSSYCNKIYQYVGHSPLLQNPKILLVIIVVPLLVLAGIAFYIADYLFFGLFTFLLNLLIFYYCLGPVNPFYPVRTEVESDNTEVAAGYYFSQVNGQLFSVIFWYVVSGVVGVLVYRLISLCREQELTATLATQITNFLDWIPARLTLLLYLLVGNFQKGFHFYVQKFLTSPEYNSQFLSEGGLLAARTNESEPVQLPYAESLVEHAIIVCVVILALFTLGSWM